MNRKLISFLLLVAPMVGGCEDAAGESELLCNSGDFIFCRCEDGSAGTKQCAADGMSTTECANCQAAPGGSYGDDTGGGYDTYTDTGAGTDTSTGTAVADEHVPGATEFMAPCSVPEDCASGMCEFGYCTRACTKVSECDFPASECAKGGGKQLCMPHCTGAKACTQYGASSQCGFSNAVDNWKVTVCSNWGGEHRLMPAETECTPLDHAACNLGYAGRQSVCSSEGKCVAGCFYNSDCLGESTCSAQGTLGTCN